MKRGDLVPPRAGCWSPCCSPAWSATSPPARPDGLDAASTQGLHHRTPTARSPAATCMARAPRTTSWPAARSPTTAYGASATRYLSTGLSGVLGVLVTFAVARRHLLAGPAAAAGARGRRQRPATAARPTPPTRRCMTVGAGTTCCTSSRTAGAPARRPRSRSSRWWSSRSPWWPPRARQFWAFGAYAVLLAAVAALARVPSAGWPGAVTDRAAVRAVRRRPAVPRHRRAGRAGSACACPWTGCTARWNILAKGTPRRARLAAARRDHHHRGT